MKHGHEGRGHLSGLCVQHRYLLIHPPTEGCIIGGLGPLLGFNVTTDFVGLCLELAGERVHEPCQRLELFDELGDPLSLRTPAPRRPPSASICLVAGV